MHDNARNRCASSPRAQDLNLEITARHKDEDEFDEDKNPERFTLVLAQTNVCLPAKPTPSAKAVEEEEESHDDDLLMIAEPPPAAAASAAAASSKQKRGGETELAPAEKRRRAATVTIE